jgi:diguanylate cyclase (GGDEF)-like protein
MSHKTPTEAKARTPKGSDISRLAAGTQHYAQQLEGLHQIGLEILEHAQPDRIIERALELIFPLVDSDGGSFWERKSDQTTFWNELTISVGQSRLPIGTRFENNQGVIGEVFASGEAVLITNFFAPEFERYPIRSSRSLMFVPLKNQHVVTGVFVIGNIDKIAAFDQNDLALLKRFTTLVSIALENARLLEHSQESTTTALSRAQQLEALHSLSLEIVSENNPTALIERALKLAITLVGADVGGYWRLQKPEHQNPYIEVILASESVKHFIGTKIDFEQTSLTVHVIKTGRAALIEDYSTSEYHNPQFKDPWQSVVAVPLWHKHQIDGVFTLVSTDQFNIFNAQHVEILERMAALCSVALENARVYENLHNAERATQQQNTLLAALHNANLELSASLEPSTLLNSLLDRAMELLQGDAGRVYLVKPNTRTLQLESARGLGMQVDVVPFGQGLSGQVAELNQGLIIEDYKNWQYNIPGAGSQWRSSIGVPLRRGEQVIGTLVIADTSTPNRYTNTELEMLERFAALAVVALENARLFDAAKTAQIEAQASRLEAHRRAQQLEAVYQTSLELTGQLEPDVVLTVLIERVAHLFLADTGAVYFRVPGTDKIELKASLGTSPTRQGTIHHGLSGGVVRSGVPKFVGNYSTWEGRDPNITTPLEWRSAMSAPITRGTQVIGALSIADTRFADRFSNKELEVLERFAAFASVALENARLHSELEARASELEGLREKAEQAASHDLLTGLANRRALERELAAARVDGEIFTLAALDLTGFKNVNDELGHDAGDNALKRIASVLTATLGTFQSQSGMKGAFRVGGDEFFMLIPKPLPAALEVCRNLLEGITSLEFPKNLRVSTNIGLAEYPTEAQTIDALFSLADTRMYAAKRVGKPFLEGDELVQLPKPKRRQSDRQSR